MGKVLISKDRSKNGFILAVVYPNNEASAGKKLLGYLDGTGFLEYQPSNKRTECISLYGLSTELPVMQEEISDEELDTIAKLSKAASFQVKRVAFRRGFSHVEDLADEALEFAR
ncbi:MAG: hypothetical protein WC796_04885 [Candidatus Pacearchaeota archaeon]|jgi:hypothetical protein